MNGMVFGDPIKSSDIIVSSVQIADGVVVDVPPSTDYGNSDSVQEGRYHDMPIAAVDRVDVPVEVDPLISSKVSPVSALPGALLNEEATVNFRTRWNEIQNNFVDEPRAAVQQADTLVSDVVAQISQMFAKEHGELEAQWKQGGDVSTEDLRKALQHYRTFFNRLVV